MSNCVCGRTTRKPMCDKSCSLSDAEYKARAERLEQLFKKSAPKDTK
jgi:CDGSH-type Zn-finger protein